MPGVGRLAAVGIERRLVPAVGLGGRPMAEAPIVGFRARSRSSRPSSSVEDSSDEFAIVEGEASVKGLIPSVATPPTPPPRKCTVFGAVVMP